MILLVFIGLLCISTLIVVCTVWFKRLIPLMIGTVFMISFYGLTVFPEYLGYAVEGKFFDGREASVIGVFEGKEWIYLEVQFTDETEPRLVKIENTDANRKKSEEAKKKAETGVSMMKFGHSGSNVSNDGDHDDGTASSVQLPSLQETQQFAKPQ